jgi:hypothetical protein
MRSKINGKLFFIFIVILMLTQVLPTVPVGNSYIGKSLLRKRADHSKSDPQKPNIPDGAELILQKNRRPRNDGRNFKRNYKANVINDIKLGAGARVLYTGNSKVLKSGNFGIQIKLLSGVDKNDIGKLAWIYYKKHERIITVDPVGSEDPIEEQHPKEILLNKANVVVAKDLPEEIEMTPDYVKKETSLASPVEIFTAIEEAQSQVGAVGEINPTSSCESGKCGEGIDAGQSNLKEVSSIDALLHLANLSDKVRNNIKSARIPEIPLLRALQFYNDNKEKRKLSDKYLVVADLTQSSNKKRMYQVDLETGEVKKYTTSHGRGYSNAKGCAHVFGNRPNSFLSSGGGFVTGRIRDFKGKHNGALSLYGVEESNSNAYGRGVILHGASYVDDDQAGRTLGCLSIANKYANSFIKSLQGYGNSNKNAEKGTAIYIYPGPDDLRRKGAYWDSSCKEKLEARNRDPRWVP